jgi:hypothetical protein
MEAKKSGVPGDSGAPEGFYADLDGLMDRLKAAAAATVGVVGVVVQEAGKNINTKLVDTGHGVEEVEIETDLPRR